MVKLPTTIDSHSTHSTCDDLNNQKSLKVHLGLRRKRHRNQALEWLSHNIGVLSESSKRGIFGVVLAALSELYTYDIIFCIFCSLYSVMRQTLYEYCASGRSLDNSTEQLDNNNGTTR